MAVQGPIGERVAGSSRRHTAGTRSTSSRASTCPSVTGATFRASILVLLTWVVTRALRLVTSGFVPKPPGGHALWKKDRGFLPVTLTPWGNCNETLCAQVFRVERRRVRERHHDGADGRDRDPSRELAPRGPHGAVQLAPAVAPPRSGQPSARITVMRQPLGSYTVGTVGVRPDVRGRVDPRVAAHPATGRSKCSGTTWGATAGPPRAAERWGLLH